MQLLTIESGKAQRLFWTLAIVAAVVGALTIRQTDPVLLATAVLLMIVGFAPIYVWLLGSRVGLPIWPAYSIYACSLAAMPALQKAQALNLFSESAILQALVTMIGFFLIGTLLWASLTVRAPKPPRMIWMLESSTAIRSLMFCILAGLLFQVNALTGWFSFPGNTMQVARGVAGGLSFLGIFAMAYFHGKGELDVVRTAIYLIMTFMLVCVALTGLMIANVIQPMALAVIGYALGKGRPPWAMLAFLFALVAILHSGKYSMRDIYGSNPESAPQITLTSLPAFYTEWFSYGLGELGGLGGILQTETKDDSPTTVFERSGNLHMLTLVQSKSPEEVPFLNGLTYAPIPQMLLPRFLVPDKAISHTGNILLSVNYGLVDNEGARNVSIGWPLIAEAYANFGQLGVLAMSVFLAAGYSFATRMSSHVPITSFRFVAGLVVMASITNENTLGVFIGSQFQAVVGVALASFFLMRRLPNPFFEFDQSAEQLVPESGGDGANGPRDQETKKRQTAVTKVGQLAGDGSMLRTMPTKTPQRMAPWMPRRIRNQVLAAQSAAEGDSMRHEASGNGGGRSLRNEETEGEQVVPKRPRQLAVPYQNYRRYRG